MSNPEQCPTLDDSPMETKHYDQNTLASDPRDFKERTIHEDGVKIIKHLFPWQKKVEDIILGDIHPTQIIWIYDKVGCRGKTELAKYLCCRYNAIPFVHSKDNVKRYISNMYKRGITPTTIIYQTSREEKKIDYAKIEGIKDGFGIPKYKIPHLIIFSNQLPDLEKISEARLRVTDISKCELLAEQLVLQECLEQRDKYREFKSPKKETRN